MYKKSDLTVILHFKHLLQSQHPNPPILWIPACWVCPVTLFFGFPGSVAKRWSNQIAVFQDSTFWRETRFNWQGKLGICLDSEIEDKLTKIKRKNSIDEFRSIVVQALVFKFVLILLLRKHSLQLPSRSHISNQKKVILNCGKVWKQLNRNCIDWEQGFENSKRFQIQRPSQLVKFTFLLDENCTILLRFSRNCVCSLFLI